MSQYKKNTLLSPTPANIINTTTWWSLQVQSVCYHLYWHYTAAIVFWFIYSPVVILFIKDNQSLKTMKIKLKYKNENSYLVNKLFIEEIQYLIYSGFHRNIRYIE